MKKTFLTMSLCLVMGLAAAPRTLASALPEAYQPAALALEAGYYKSAAAAISKLPDGNEKNAMLTLAYRLSGDKLRAFLYSKQVPNIEEAAYTISSFYVERLAYSPNARKVILEIGSAVSSPENGMAWLADVHEKKGSLDTAMQLYTLGHESYPKSDRLAAGLAQQYLKKGDADKAILYFTRAHLLKTDNPIYMVGLGQAFYMNGRPDKALDLWNKALVLDPSNAQLYKDIQRVQAEIRGEVVGTGLKAEAAPSVPQPGAQPAGVPAPDSGTAGVVQASPTAPPAIPQPLQGAKTEDALKQVFGVVQSWLRN